MNLFIVTLLRVAASAPPERGVHLVQAVTDTSQDPGLLPDDGKQTERDDLGEPDGLHRSNNELDQLHQ